MLRRLFLTRIMQLLAGVAAFAGISAKAREGGGGGGDGGPDVGFDFHGFPARKAHPVKKVAATKKAAKKRPRKKAAKKAIKRRPRKKAAKKAAKKRNYNLGS